MQLGGFNAVFGQSVLTPSIRNLSQRLRNPIAGSHTTCLVRAIGVQESPQILAF